MKEKIYLIPGLMTDIRLWSRLIPYLQNEYELVHIPIPHSEDFDEIIDILFNTFKEEKINLLGFSLGGYIASYFAITYPNRVNRLFTVAATPGNSTEAEIERRKEKFVAIEKDGFTGLTYEKAKSLVEEKNQEDIELIKIIQNMFMDLGKETFVSGFEIRHSAIAQRQAEQLQAQILWRLLKRLKKIRKTQKSF